MALPPSPKLPQRPGSPAGPGKPLPAGEDAIAKSKREKDELESACGALEDEVEELKAKYEQYFLGVERREPVRWREEAKKKVLRLKGGFTRNTGLKFRIQALHARFISYERLWLRSAREKEDGTYRRDLFKARLRAHHEEPETKSEPAGPAPEPSRAEAKSPPAPAGAKAGPPTPRPSAPPAPGGMNDAQMRALYNAYIAAKKTCNEDVSRLSYDAVARSVSKQIPDLMTRYKAKSVDFRVEVKDGKAILKAVPKV